MLQHRWYKTTIITGSISGNGAVTNNLVFQKWVKNGLTTVRPIKLWSMKTIFQQSSEYLMLFLANSFSCVKTQLHTCCIWCLFELLMLESNSRLLIPQFNGFHCNSLKKSMKRSAQSDMWRRIYRSFKELIFLISILTGKFILKFSLKELSLCHKLWFFNSYIFETQWRRPLISKLWILLDQIV